MSMREEAQDLREIGIPVGMVEMEAEKKFPVGVSGWSKKLPSLKNWPKYKIDGVCVFTGDIEIVDVDSKHWKEEGNFSEIFREWLKGYAWESKLVCYKTINNGLQYPYRTDSSEGNKKLAIRLTGKEAVIETRGKGGLAVCPPTLGYEWLDGGEWEAIPTLTTDERNEFVNACRDWNQGIDEKEIDLSEAKAYVHNTGKPGDDWASKNDFMDFIKDHGWAVDKVVGETVLLRRPGKDSGTSASWNYGGIGRLFVWTSSTGLPTEKMLKPFAVKAYLEYNGDFKACAIALREQGYGNDALALVEACSACTNWGEVGMILQEHKDKIQIMSSDKWNELSFGIQSLAIKGVTESKLDKMKKGAVSKAAPVDWQDNLTFDEDEKVKNRIYNADMILTNDPKYQGLFFWDDFAQKIAIRNKKTNEVLDFDDTFEAMLQVKLGREYGDFRMESIKAVVLTIAKQNHFHPLQEKIKSIEWDGRTRVETWLSHYCGAEDSEYLRLVARKWMISAIARLFRPGCKVDNVLVLEGEQGTKKSSLLRALCYDNFLDGGIDIRSKDGKMALFGKWIVEFSELEGLNGRSSDEIKAFLAKQDDKLRIPYARGEDYFKRTCVFVGTTNKEQYLEDPTGNRRFWPVKIKQANLTAVEADRDQLWAEAYQTFRNGEKWWIDEGGSEALIFKSEQGERVVHSDLEDKIYEWLIQGIREDGRVLVKLHEVWTDCIGGKLSQIDRKKEHEIAECLRRMGLKKGKTSVKGVPFKGWYGPLKEGS